MNRITLVLLAMAALITACGKESTAGAPVTSTLHATATLRAKSATPMPPASAKPVRIGACTSAQTVAEIAPGESPSERIWHSAIIVTNRGSALCTLQGASKLELYTGGDGKPLGIKEIPRTGAAEELIALRPGGKASMAILIHTAPKPVPAGCLDGASFAEVTMPGDNKAIEAWLPDHSMWLPPVCGAVEVSPWESYGS